MIKVIKHGHSQYKMTCKFCECIFSFEDEDIQNNNNPKDWNQWVTCPDCKCKNNVPDRRLFKYYSN